MPLIALTTLQALDVDTTKHFAKCSKNNVNILEIGNEIQNHDEKCTKIKYKHASFGLQISEMAVDLFKKVELVYAWQM